MQRHHPQKKQGAINIVTHHRTRGPEKQGTIQSSSTAQGVKSSNAINPILKNILIKKSELKDVNNAADHVKLIESRRKQMLHDYILVCIQRLSRSQDTVNPVNENLSEVHSIVKQTLQRWRH